MSSSLFSADGFMFILRWLHFFFGVMWIGHLYYFNFTQGNYMGAADGAAKLSLQTKLLPRALYWFRWGAMWTMITGVLYTIGYLHKSGQSYDYLLSSSWGIAITIGMILGLTMWANVWFVIWPKQKVVIKSAEQVVAGGQALPEAAAAGAAATLASRTNTLFSIPLLFFMGAASHLPLAVTPESNTGMLWGLFLVLWLALEINALKGKTGVLTTVKGVITSGFVLTAIIYGIVAISL